jgi:hypothetical protein
MPLDFERDGATPALLAVAKLVEDFNALAAVVNNDISNDTSNDEDEVADLLKNEPSTMSLLAFAMLKANVLPEDLYKNGLGVSSDHLRNALLPELLPESAAARLLVRRAQKGEETEEADEPPMTTHDAVALLRTWLKPDSKLLPHLDAAVAEYEALTANLKTLTPGDLTGAIFAADANADDIDDTTEVLMSLGRSQGIEGDIYGVEALIALLKDLPPSSESFGKVEKAIDAARALRAQREENEKAWREREAKADVIAGPGTVSRTRWLRERVWAGLFDTLVYDPADVARKLAEGRDIKSLSSFDKLPDEIVFFDEAQHTGTWRTNLTEAGTLGRADQNFGQDASMQLFSADVIVTAENMDLALVLALSTAAIELRVGEKTMGSFGLNDAIEIARGAKRNGVDGDEGGEVVRARFRVPLTGHTVEEEARIRESVAGTPRFEKVTNGYYNPVDEAAVRSAEERVRDLVASEGGPLALAHLGLVHESKTINVAVRQSFKVLLWPSTSFREAWNDMPGYKSIRVVLNSVVTRDLA